MQTYFCQTCIKDHTLAILSGFIFGLRSYLFGLAIAVILYWSTLQTQSCLGMLKNTFVRRPSNLKGRETIKIVSFIFEVEIIGSALKEFILKNIFLKNLFKISVIIFLLSLLFYPLGLP